MVSFKIPDTNIYVNAGQTGGYIQSESNLPIDWDENSDNNDCSWIAHESKIFGNATLVNGSVAIQKSAIYGDAVIDHSTIKDFGKVFGNAHVKNSSISDNATVNGSAIIENCILRNASKICGNARVSNSKLWHGSYITDNSVVDNCELYDASRVYGNSHLVNCKLESATLIQNSEHYDEVISRELQLYQSYPAFDDGSGF